MTEFRNHLIPNDDPRLTDLRALSVREYAEYAKTDPFAGPMIEGWAQLYPEPFRGISADGQVDPSIFVIEPHADEVAPTASMVQAARSMLSLLSSADCERVRYPADAHEWRSWANPEFLQHDTGLRLDEIPDPARDAFLELTRSSLSEDGYELVRTLMRINGFLGEIVELPHLMNEFSYNVALFGEPSEQSLWGWQLFGHHVALNCVVEGPRMTLSPVFLGAEPNSIDEGPFAPARVFGNRIETARAVMAALPQNLERRVTTYSKLVDPAMPEGRLHPGDERHLGGCFQDNRVIPYEGVSLREFPEQARSNLDLLIESFLLPLPEGPRRVRMRDIASFADETWFSWIGGSGPDDPFYFRIQSPVVILELDHHRGVFLSNDEPADFHIHTVMRTPNGLDYGGALLPRTQHRGSA